MASAPTRHALGPPPERTSFYGRAGEVTELKRLVRGARFVTVTGVGGVGKTRVALRAAADLAPEFPDGVCLVELSPLTDPELLAHTVATALWVQDQTTRPMEEVLLRHLEDRRVLLILDTCDRHLGACVRLAELLRPARHVKILATSRQALGAAWEQTLVLAPMDVTALGRPFGEAVGFFLDRARAVVPNVTFLPSDTATIAGLCRRLDGIPLAIELAAGRLSELSVAQLETDLDDRFALLRDATRATVPRHQTLRAAIEWSHELCEPVERLLWTRLAAFRGSFDGAAAETVCADDRLPASLVEPVLRRLVEKSIVLPDAAPAGERYLLLDTIRDYASDRLRALAEPAAVGRRHRDYYLDLAERFDADWFGPRQLDWTQRMAVELPNLRAAMAFSLTTPGEGGAAAQLAGALHYFWWANGAVREGTYWLDRSLAADPRPSLSRHRALAAHTMLLNLQGDQAAGLARGEECLREAHALGSSRFVARASTDLAALHHFAGDLAAATRLIDDAVARYGELGEESLESERAKLIRAGLWLTEGNPAEAEAIIARAGTLLRSRGERFLLAYALTFFGHAAIALGDIARAGAYAREGLVLRRTFSDPAGVAGSLERLAWIAAREQQFGRAARLLGAADREWEQIGATIYGSAQWVRTHDECVSLTREALGDAAYAAECRRGAALGIDNAVNYALEAATTA
jgi:predicted ATPase